MFVARKVTRAKWQATAGLRSDEIPADAVSVDLRTRGNTLSFWKCAEASAEALELAALALAAQRDTLDKVELVWLPVEALSSRGVGMEQTPGETPLSCMVDRHVDAVRLDYARLGIVAAAVASALEQEAYRRWTRKQVRTVLVKGVCQGLIELDTLKAKVRAEIEPELRKLDDAER